MSHVLEHFADSANVIRKIWHAVGRLGIDTVVVVVPGEKGYASDSTHKTFVTEEIFRETGSDRYQGFEIRKVRYFPGDSKALGKYFTFHELKIVWSRAG
jgi:hypothetical protein